MSVDGDTISAVINLFIAQPRLYIKAVSLDGSTIGAFLGFLGIVSSTIGGVYIATSNRKSEKASVAQETLNTTKNEVYESRLREKDERIGYLEKRLADCEQDARLDAEEYESEIDKLNRRIARLEKKEDLNE